MVHPFLAAVSLPSGQGSKQIGELALAFALSSLIGLEREWRQKSAGLRTHTPVGVGAALFLIVSKYGFTDVLGPRVVLDPSRVAAQIVTGIGFIGGGLIFVRGDAVRGLTTARSFGSRPRSDELHGQPTVEPLAAALSEQAGVLEVTSTDLDGSID
jgi:hypothetical protein